MKAHGLQIDLTDLAMLERVEAENNKKVFFSSQEFPQNAAGRLSIGVMGVVARWYTDNLREEVNKGLRGKVEAGEYPHRPPYGYRMGKDTGGSRLPVPDPEKAEKVRTIFELMASGNYSIDALREGLFQRGIYFSSSTRRWTWPHLATLLRHPFYIGTILWGVRNMKANMIPSLMSIRGKKCKRCLMAVTIRRTRYDDSLYMGRDLSNVPHCGIALQRNCINSDTSTIDVPS